MSKYQKISDYDISCLKYHFSKKPVEGKERILAYLKSRRFVDYASTKRITDAVSGTVCDDICDTGYTDGIFSWTSADIYYFEKYDLILSDDFINHLPS